MIAGLLYIIGGIGLFLAGMLILTEGLRALTGGSLRKILSRYTKSPTSGAATGALTTALIQSSSATIVTAVGFVGAGMLTFNQSLGIIFGANIGTTLTGWLVAVLGFKIKLGTLVLPFVMLGVVLRIYGKGISRNIGWALVGFCLLFIGIATMQDGASSFEGTLVPSIFPPDTFWGRLQLVGIGMAITLVTQSSSAGVATAMVALGSGAINFPQAAALVIGMDVGTTFTAALATVGGSTPMRRTGYAHVIYNVLTGIMAFFLLGPAKLVLGAFALTDAATGGAQIGLALFHSFFNVMGVVLVLPFTNLFANLVKRLVPKEKPVLTETLDTHLLKEPAAAADAALFTVHQIWEQLLECLVATLKHHKGGPDVDEKLTAAKAAIQLTREYIQKINAEPNSAEYQSLVDAMHTLDHLGRLQQRCSVSARLMPSIASDWRLQRLSGLMRRHLQYYGVDQTVEGGSKATKRLFELLSRQNEGYRKRLMKQMSGGMSDGKEMLLRLDSMRWLLRVSYHLWRIQKHIV